MTAKNNNLVSEAFEILGKGPATLRWGQCLFIAFHHLNPIAANLVRGTKDDPFNWRDGDERLPVIELKLQALLDADQELITEVAMANFNKTNTQKLDLLAEDLLKDFNPVLKK